MKKFSFFLITFVFFAFSVYAQDIDDIISAYSKVKTFQADFVQKTTIKDFGEDYYQGKVYLIKGEKLLWSYEKPYYQYYLFTKNVMEYYDSTLRQLIRQQISVENNVVLQLIFDFASIKKNFEIGKIDKEWYLLKPKSEMNIKYIKILAGKKFIQKIVSEDEAGNITVIIFKNVKINEKIDEAVFKPILPLDTEIFEN